MKRPSGILYSFRRCPFAMRARMALAASGAADPEIREIVLRDKPTHMLELSPKGTVPVFQVGTGEVLAESLDIMDWALGQADPTNWLRNRGNAELESLLLNNDSGFKYELDRYKYPHRCEDDDATGARAFAEAYLPPLEARLSAMQRQHGASFYLDGEQPGFFDAAIFPFMRQFSSVEPNWFCALALSNLIDWRARMLQSTVFTRVMKKLPVWKEGDEPLRFSQTLAT